MMEIPDRLHSLFTATIDEEDESFVIEIPKNEVQLGDLEVESMYQVAILNASEQQSSSKANPAASTQDSQDPPVKPGETRQVEIEGIGDQGDGITRVERGFVVIVPDTEVGERVKIKITDVSDTVAFAKVEERIDYYE